MSSGPDLLGDHRRSVGADLPLRGGRLDEFPFQRGNLAVEQLGGLGQITVALGPLGLRTQVVELLLQLRRPG